MPKTSVEFEYGTESVADAVEFCAEVDGTKELEVEFNSEDVRGTLVTCTADASDEFEGADEPTWACVDEGAEVPKMPGKDAEKFAKLVTPGTCVPKLELFVDATATDTLFSNLNTPEANSPNASTSTRNCNSTSEASTTGMCNAARGSTPPHVSKLPIRAQPLVPNKYTSTLGSTLPQTPSLGSPPM